MNVWHIVKKDVPSRQAAGARVTQAGNRVIRMRSITQDRAEWRK